MTEVVSIRFENNNKVFFFDPGDMRIDRGSDVVVETAKGQNYGECVYGNHSVEDTAIVQPLRPVVRVATEDDRRRVRENLDKKDEAFACCQKKIAEYRLPMKLISVEYSFDGNKLVFCFTAESRVDFRTLVRDMAATFRTRIELRQVGVRDEARMVGGLGICGRPFCCSQFLHNFHPVSIKMAKIQGLSLNPTKISGACGRLMCCLKYEEEAYVDIVKRAPKADSFVETPSGKGSIASVNLLRGNARVRLEDTADTTLKTYAFDEMIVLGGKSRRAEYIAAKAEGRLKEAGFSEGILPELAALAKRDAPSIDAVLSSLNTGGGEPARGRQNRQPQARGKQEPRGKQDKPDKQDKAVAPEKLEGVPDDDVPARERGYPKKNKKWKGKRGGSGGGAAGKKDKSAPES